MTSSQRSCQYSCSILDCVLAMTMNKYVLRQGPAQCTQSVQYNPCTMSPKHFLKLCQNQPTDRQTDIPIPRGFVAKA